MDAERDGEEEGEGGGEVVHVDDDELSVLVGGVGDGGPGDLLHPWLHHGYKLCCSTLSLHSTTIRAGHRHTLTY